MSGREQITSAQDTPVAMWLVNISLCYEEERMYLKRRHLALSGWWRNDNLIQKSGAMETDKGITMEGGCAEAALVSHRIVAELGRPYYRCHVPYTGSVELLLSCIKTSSTFSMVLLVCIQISLCKERGTSCLAKLGDTGTSHSTLLHASRSHFNTSLINSILPSLLPPTGTATST